MFAIFTAVLDIDEEKHKLTKIYETYYGTMLAVAKGILSDHALAEASVSEAIMTIIKNLHKIDDTSSYKTKAYIIIIARSRAINLLNKHKNHPEESIDDFALPDRCISTLESLTMKESYENIVGHIKALPKTLSDVLYLSAVLDHSTEEISRLLNISKDAVRQRLCRAKAQIRITLAQEGIEYAEK